MNSSRKRARFSDTGSGLIRSDDLTSDLSRAEFLKPLDKFYKAIELAADTIDSFNDRQHFLNTVYERFLSRI